MATTYSDEVLEATPARATTFLHGLGAVPILRTTLAQAGMTDDDITEGRTLLLACLAAPRASTEQADTEGAKAQREASAELDGWDEPNFQRYHAALDRRYPSAGEYVFANLKASTGAQAVNGVATFLLRVDALDKGSDPARASSKKDDKKAVALLATRGLTTKERARLSDLVEVALGPTPTLPDGPSADQDAASARRAALVALKQWYDEWATTAHAVVKKRVYLIRLGLASRKPPNKGGGAGGGGGGGGPTGPTGATGPTS